MKLCARAHKKNLESATYIAPDFSDLVFSDHRLTRAVQVASLDVLDDAVDDFIRLKKIPTFFFKVMDLATNLVKYGWDRQLEHWEIETLRRMLDAMYITHEDGDAESIGSMLTKT